MGSSNHLKRLAMPRSWPLPRKTTIWVTRPTPGAHSLELCMPINLVIRDVLGFARSTREVRHILHNGLAMIDGRVCKETRRGVGLMDVLSLGDNHYRCVLDHNGRLRYRPISADEHIKFAEGVRCYLIGGAHVGGFANMTSFEVKRSSMANEVQFDEFGTVASNVFAVGDATLPNTEVVE